MRTGRLVLSAMTAVAMAAWCAVPADAVEVKQRGYKGCETISMQNDQVELLIAPQLGGRIIQYRLGVNEMLWIDRELIAKKPPESGVGPDGKWINYGGDKLWPAPQGWGGPDEWPGPPGPVPNAEGLPYKARIVEAKGSEGIVELTGPKDPYTGIRFSRKIRVFDDSTRVSIESTMTNVDTKPRRWGIWSVTQMDCTGPNKSGFNPLIRAFCPINPKSVYPNGYKLLYGPADNPAWQPDAENKMMRVQYGRQVGKIALDSTAGWLAVVNGRNGRCMVQRFKTFPDKKYPDGASVEFWINAGGTIKTGDTEVEIPNDVKQTPPYLEAELISPFANLKPGESYSVQTDWYACNVGGDYPIVDCTEVGVVSERVKGDLIFWHAGPQLRLRGRLASFGKGRVGMAFFDSAGQQIQTVRTDRTIGPSLPLLAETLTAKGIDRNLKFRIRGMSLFLADPDGKSLGELARVDVRVGVE